jgi:hypothetical protein
VTQRLQYTAADEDRLRAEAAMTEVAPEPDWPPSWFGSLKHGAPAHEYVSTACYHGECGSCRNTCKFCDAPCGHECHPGDAARAFTPWVDQARDMARMLLMEVRAAEGPWTPQLAERIATDPGLFWLRGEEAPPGTWHA